MTSRKSKSAAKRKTATKKAVAKPKKKRVRAKPAAVADATPKGLLGYAIEILESIQDDMKALRLHMVPATDNAKQPELDLPNTNATLNTDNLDGSDDPSNDEAFA